MLHKLMVKEITVCLANNDLVYLRIGSTCCVELEFNKQALRLLSNYIIQYNKTLVTFRDDQMECFILQQA